MALVATGLFDDDDELKRDFEWYCLATGSTQEQAIRDAVRKMVTPYKTSIPVPIRALYTPLVKPGQIYHTYECLVIGKEIINEQEYYRIICDGKAVAVPAICVFCLKTFGNEAVNGTSYRKRDRHHE